ncbi:ribonuclease H [Hokovirus HKV1]|uniref:ribonuclease H n=1 Tax=Hokovirus HKV1 TaxID=1977638 RepID=A0A1V0SH60_9VIRU|nr:ribonuclease H [Hokovirus HKV1]
MDIILFTDGSSTVFKDKKNMKYGGIGIYSPKIIKMSQGYTGNDITNQKMELQACIYGIKNVYNYMLNNHLGKLWNLVIYTDSMYVINSITDYASKWILYGWKRKVNKKMEIISNLELIKELYILYRTLPITFKHTNSHTKEPARDSIEWPIWKGNNKADKLAKNAMLKMRDE